MNGLHDEKWYRKMASNFPDSIVFRAGVCPACLTWEEVVLAVKLTRDAHIARDWTLANMMPDLPLKVRR